MQLYKSSLMGRMSLGLVDMCLYAVFSLCTFIYVFCVLTTTVS